MANGFAVSSKTPTANALDVVKTTNVVVQFNANVKGSTVTENTFDVDGSISGEVAGAYSGGGTFPAGTWTGNVEFNAAPPAGDFATVWVGHYDGETWTAVSSQVLNQGGSDTSFAIDLLQRRVSRYRTVTTWLAV